MIAAMACALFVTQAQPASEPAPAADAESAVSQEQLVLQLDRAVETLLSKSFGAAAPKLFYVFRTMSEDELQRDVAQFYLAEALRELGFTQAAAEHYIDVATARRSPDMAARALTALDGLYRRGLVEENRLIDDVLFGAQFGGVEPVTQGFVDYLQALGELRRGYGNWGESRLEALFQNEGHYAHRGRFALGVLRVQEDNQEGAEKIFKQLIEGKDTPKDVRNDARAAMGRMRYEQKKFEEAFVFYADIDAPPSTQAAILLEKAWTKIAAQDEQRALGMTVGLGAPIYKRSFAPERELLRALSLNRLCQFRAAHETVLSFRDKYGNLLDEVRERHPLKSLSLLVDVARSREDMRELERVLERTVKEQEEIDRLGDADLRDHAKALYTTRQALLERKRDRKLEVALDKAADDLLAVDEQMSILDYEIGIGLFKRVGARKGAADLHDETLTTPPSDDKRAFFRFNGEYWSDELRDFAVLARDRCVR
jgi:hypothetical protein